MNDFNAAFEENSGRCHVIDLLEDTSGLFPINVDNLKSMIAISRLRIDSPR